MPSPSHYGRRLETRLDLLRPAELDFLTGLRAGLLATAFLAVALPEDFFAAGFLTAAALTDRFGLPRGLAGGFPRFSDNLRRLSRQGSHRATGGLGGIFRTLDTRLGYL